MVDFILEALEYGGYITIMACVALFAGRFIRSKYDVDLLEFFFDSNWKPKERFSLRIGFLALASFVFAVELLLEKHHIVPSPMHADKTESWKHLLLWQQMLVPSLIYTILYLISGVLLRLLAIADVYDPSKSIFTEQWCLKPRWWFGIIKIFLLIYAMIASIYIAFKL